MNRHFIAQYSLSTTISKYVVKVFFNEVQLIEIYAEDLETLRQETRFFCNSINDSNLEQLIEYAEN